MNNNYDGYVLNEETVNILINVCNDKILDLVKGSFNRNGMVSDETSKSVEKWKHMLDILEEISINEYYVGYEEGENIKNLNN